MERLRFHGPRDLSSGEFISGRDWITVGGGIQIATTHFHRNNHNGIFSVRFLSSLETGGNST